MEITEKIKKNLLTYLKKQKNKDLISAYLYFIEITQNITPVLFPKEKKIYQSLDVLINKLEKENNLYKKTIIKIQFGQKNVNEQTKKIYICPFTGKVFGDNTHPNPQDAIYDWVSKCPENTERKSGLKAKRFFVSEDPNVIKNYIKKRKEPIEKEVFSSCISGKLFNNKESVIEDFKKNHIKHMTITEVQNQNKFEIEEHFLHFLEKMLTEEKITQFVQKLSEHKEFSKYVKNWLA